jgi:hypothetical protein
MLFQVFKDDILELPSSLIEKVNALIKPSPLGDKIGQRLADLHRGTIIVPKARHCFMYRRTLDTIQTERLVQSKTYVNYRV